MKPLPPSNITPRRERVGRGLLTAIVTLCLLWVGGIFCLVTQRPDPAPPSAIEQVNPLAQSFLVDCPNGNGSCIPVARWKDFTIFLTAKHVIEGEPVEGMKVGAWPVTRVDSHPGLDVALLWVQAQTPLVEMDTRPLSFGEEVYAAAWCADRRVLTKGYISDFATCSTAAFFGMSGGGIIRDGKLVGTLIQLGATRRGIAACVTIFVPISASLPWIRDTIPS